MKFCVRFLTVVSLSVCLLSGNAWAAVYAQLSSSQDQIVNSTRPRLVTVETIDRVGNIELASTKDKVVVKTSGTYFIMAVAQVGGDKNVKGNASGYVDLWLMRNNASLPNSNARHELTNVQATATLVSQSIVQLNAGDTIGIGFSAIPSFGLIALPAANGEPAIPSMIFSIFMI